jgi:N-acetylgalactosamine-N,N'-diacetylbacillosaminyl-diphospho-undecaprenol 4-alpha-N-acetylgalactosaminyltransferase
VVSYLLPYLKKRGIDVCLVLMNTTIKYNVPADVPIYYLERSNPAESGLYKWIKLPFLAFRYARLLKKINVTHSFSLLTRPNYINILARWLTGHKFRMIISERNYPSLQYGYGDMQSKVNTYLVKRLYRFADRIICNAQASSEDLVENFNCDPGKMYVIYNPIDKSAIDAIPALEDFFDPAYINAITIGRLQDVKNQALLIRAIEDCKNVRLYILGEGYLKESLNELIRAKGLEDRVFLLGFEKNPYKFLKSADMFLLGSNHEGFPNVLLEAMCCGLPIVSTNCKSGPSEMMELDKPSENDIMVTDYGILVPVNDLQSMRKGLNYIIDNTAYYNACKENVLKRVTYYAKDQILKEYEQALLE